MPNMVSATFGTVLIAVHNDQPLEEESWQSYLELAKRLLQDSGGDLSKIQGLTFTDGGAPNSSQRNRLRALMGDKPTTAAIVTDSMAARTVIGILMLFVKGIAVFRPVDWEGAFRQAGVPPDRDEELKVLLRTLRARIGVVRSLEPALDGGNRGS